MTGGQPVDGPLDRADIARQVAAEGVTAIVVVTDEPDKYPAGDLRRAASTIHHRDELDAVQRELREIAGRHGPHLRPDLRGREAPPPQARQVRRSGEARRHQRARLRRLRRLRRASRTACRSCRSRPSSAASARSTSRRATRTTPASRASARASSPSKAATLQQAAEGRRARRLARALPEPALPATRREPYGILVTGIGGTGVVTDRRAARHGGAPRRQGLQRARHDRASRRRAARSCRTCASPTRRSDSTRRASPRARPTWCSAATS